MEKIREMARTHKKDVTGVMTRSTRAVHERLNSRNSQDNAEELFKTGEGTTLHRGKDLLVKNAMKNKEGSFSHDREYVSDVH